MPYIQKPTYKIKEAAKIISDETGVKHTKKNIYEVANQGKFKICFNPQWGTSKHGEFCFLEPAGAIERLESPIRNEFFIVPKSRKTKLVKRVFNKNMSEEVFPVLHDAGILMLVKNFKKKFDIPLVNPIEAVNNKGESVKVVGVYEKPVLSKDKIGKIFWEWIEENNIPTCKSDLGKDYNLYYYQHLNKDEKRYLQPVNVNDLYLTKFELDKYINSLINSSGDTTQNEQQKTIPVKGKPETQKQRVLEELGERRLSLNDNPEYGVMKEIKKALIDDSNPKLAEKTIDKLFADIGLVSGHNTQKK